MNEESILACRICRLYDTNSFISIFDEILSVPIVTLMAELIQCQEINLANKLAPTLICTECARGLRQAIKLKRQMTLNENAYNNPDMEIRMNDPFLADDDLQFVEKAQSDAKQVENEYEKMKVEIFDEGLLDGDENSNPDPLFDQNVNLGLPARQDRRTRQRSLEKCERPTQQQMSEAKKTSENENEVFSSDDSDDEDFFVDKNFVEPSDEEQEAVVSPVNDTQEQMEEGEPAEDDAYEGMISYDEEYLESEPEAAVKQSEAPHLTIKRVGARGVNQNYELEIPEELLKVACCMCHFIATSENDLKTHLLSHPERIRRRSFRGLYQKAIVDMKPKSKSSIECVKCCRSVDVAKMSTHLKYYYVRKKFACSGCGERFGFFSEMRKHEKKCVVLAKNEGGTERPLFPCDICGKQLMSKATLSRHIYNIHEMTEKDRVKFKCNICQKGYPSSKNLKEHIKTHTQTATFVCTLCEKAFKTKVNLDIHLRVHFNERIYKCNYCEKSYIHYSDRHRHELSVHTGERPHRCPICNEGFVKKYSMNLHIRKAHTGEKPFVCEFSGCEQSFYQGSQLKQHISKHHHNNQRDEVVVEVVTE